MNLEEVVPDGMPSLHCIPQVNSQPELTAGCSGEPMT